MELTWAIIIIIAVIIVWYLWQKNQCKEGLGGYGVTSALHFYDRIAYCDEGNEARGGSYAGGCFLPHKVII
jgi:hypothetical protein